jgi:hypothetical protein
MGLNPKWSLAQLKRYLESGSTAAAKRS